MIVSLGVLLNSKAHGNEAVIEEETIGYPKVFLIAYKKMVRTCAAVGSDRTDCHLRRKQEQCE